MPERIGRYEVLSVLGTGGMARVYLARLRGDAGFTQLVAIKRALPHVASEPAGAAMLLDEARVAASIRHANVVPTLDVIDDPEGAAVVMQFVEGVSLLSLFNHLARAERPMPVNVAVSIVWGALSGLHAAHEAKGPDGAPLGVVHRDVSANNVMIGVDGVVRVLDFGVAKMRSRAQPTTEEGNVKGTLATMAPEQIERKPLDRRVDVYAASVLLWQCLAGRRLWQASDAREIITAALFDEPPDLHALRDEVDPALDAVVRRGLAKGPDDRWPSALAMANALEAAVPLVSSARMAEWLAREAPELVAKAAPPAIAAPTPLPAAPPVDTELATRSANEVVIEPRGSASRWPLIGMGALGFALVLTLVAKRVVTSPEREPTSATPASVSIAPSSTASSALPLVASTDSARLDAPVDAAPPHPAGTATTSARHPSNVGRVVAGASASPVTTTSSVPATPSASVDAIPAHRRPGAIPDTRR